MARILVVDDDVHVRTVLQRLLVAAGHTVDLAEEGGEALQKLAEDQYALVVLDLLMPGMEGIETIMRLRQEHEGVKIIAISGGGRRANLDFLATAKKLGAHHALKKPFRMEDLFRAIEELLAAAD